MRELLPLQNKWWLTKAVPREFLGTFKREMFANLAKDIQDKKITSILGPRRVGKTILMHQLIDYLLKRGVSEQRILYMQFDFIEEKKGIIRELLAIMSERLSEPLDELKQTIYLFLDEVHKFEYWAEEVKQFQDMQLKIKFVVSGSSSLRIIKGSGESLIGRISHFIVLPLSFREFLSLKDISLPKFELNYAELRQILNKNIHNLQRINISFKEFLTKGGYPETLGKNIEESFKLMLDYKDLSLQRDLFELEGIRDAKSLRELINILASTAAERTNYSKLASLLGIKSNTVKRYVGLLEDIYLITEAKVFSKKPYFSIRKERKVFFLDNGMLNAVSITHDNMPKLVENASARKIFEAEKDLVPEVYYWLDEFGKEIDFVIEKEIMPVEIKFRNQILKKDMYTLKKFLKMFKADKGIIVTYDLLDKKVSNGKEILFVPAWLFLLA